MRSIARVLAVSTSSLLLLGVMPGQSSALATASVSGFVLTTSTPAANSYVKADPTTISATFSQTVANSSTISLKGPTGAAVTCIQGLQLNSATMSCTVAAGTLAEGLYEVDYNATPSTGTGSANSFFTFHLDKTKPAAPTVAIAPSPYLLSDKTAGTAVTVSGTAEPGTTVSASLASSGGGTALPAQSATSNATTGGFSFTFSNTIADGTLTASATETDQAGNVGTAGTKTATKDTVAPLLTSSSPPDNGSVRSTTAGNPTPFTATANEALNASSRVHILQDGLELQTTPNVSGSTVTATPPGALSEGDYTAQIVLVDAAGNVAATITQAFSIDDSVPSEPVISAAGPVNKANQASYTVSGTGEAKATVSFTVTGGSSVAGTAVVDAQGAWSKSINATGLTDGSVTINATQADAAANTSLPAATITTTKDVVAPRVTTQALDRASYGIANTTAVASGKIDDGSSTNAEADPYTVSLDDTDPATAPVLFSYSGKSKANGTFASDPLTLSGLSDGTLTATIIATDDAGNPSTAVTATATKDTVAPAAPTVTTVTDPINNANKTSVAVAGKAENGASVALALTDTATPPVSVTASATANGSGDYSATGINVSSLADGTITVTAVATDAAGNASASGTKTATKDVAAPAVPTLVVPATTNAGQAAAVAVSGSGEAGATVHLTAKNGTLAPTVMKDAVVDGTGAWATTLDLTTLADGTITVTATQSDAAGNTSTSTSGSTIKDVVAPGTPATLTASPSPYVKANATSDVVISGTTASADSSASGLVADLSLSDGTPAHTLVFKGAPVTSGSFSHAFTKTEVATLDDATLTVTAVVRDAVGNVGPAKTTTLLKDTTALAFVSSSPASGATVSPPSTISGTFNEALNQTSSTIVVKTKSGNTVAGGMSFGAGGKSIIFTPSSALSEAGNDYTLTMHAVDLGDSADVVDPTPSSFRVDTTPPAAPGVTSAPAIAAANQAAYDVSGTGEVGATVTVTLSGGAITLTKTTLVVSNPWTVRFDATSLPEGSVAVSATQTDVAGNTSTASAPLSVVKDTTGPSVTGLAGTSTNTASPTTSVTGTTEKTATVTLSAKDTDVTHPAVTGTATVNASTGAITGSLDLSSLNDGTVTITATATDSYSNVGSAATTTISKDTSAPAISGLAGSTVTKAKPSTTVTGTTTSGSDAVALSASDGTSTSPVTGTATVTPDGTFSGTLDLSSLSDGTITVSATPTDAAGNPGTAATTQLTKDATVPTVSKLAATPTNAGTASSTVTGMRSETSSVALTLGDGTSTVTALVASGSGAFSQAVDIHTLTDGVISVTAVATDGVGNTSTATTSTSKDTAAPVVSSLAATATTAATTSTTVTGSVTEPASIVISATDGTSPATTTITVPAGSFTTTIALGALADGPVTVTAAPTDAGGNTGSVATAATTKDATAPAVTGLAATAVSAGGSSSTISGSVSEAASIVITAADATKTVTATITSPAGAFSTSVDVSSLTDGTISVTAKPTDSAGNAGAVASASTTKASAVPAAMAAPTVKAGNGAVAVAFTPNGSGNSYTVTSSPGGRTKTGTTSPLIISGLTNGTSYRFTVKATNTVGNTGASSPASAAVTPRGTSMTVLNATPPAVRSGTVITLAGKVTRPSSTGAFGSVILRLTFDNGAVTNLGAVTPASNGTFTKNVRATYNGSYTATYGGDVATVGSASGARKTLANAAITASYTAKSAAASTLVVKGTVAPLKKGAVLYLNEVLSNGRTKLLAKQGLNAKSAFSFSLKLPRGSHRLQLVIKATQGNAAGTATFTLTRT